MADTILVGCGTGRCGTVSLANLLGIQDGFEATHERKRFPWATCPSSKLQALSFWEHYSSESPKECIYADVAFYWLPYLEVIWAIWPMAKVVCLKRDRDETIRSYMRKTEWGDPFRRSRANATCLMGREWNDCYPDYSYCFTKEDAVGAYWDDYYRWAECLANDHPDHFRIFSMDHVLNFSEGQRELLSFCDIPEEKHRYDLDIRLNASK